jgi:hypothetical protein
MMPTNQPGEPSGLYRSYAPRYWKLGWRGVLPLPSGRKLPPPDDYTGYDGLWPSWADIQSWMDSKPALANIALRLPANVIGIDVDAYSTKNGEATFAAAKLQWGELPPTWRSSARADDPISGIRFFRVPEDKSFVGQIKMGEKLSHIEIVQLGHRYAVVEPSIHPEGGIYRWYGPDGEFSGPPAVDELPMLPEKWVAGLEKQRASVDDVNVKEILDGIPSGDMDDEVREELLTGIRATQAADGSRHDIAMKHVARLLRLAERKHPGVLLALDAFEDEFVIAVSDRTPEGEARAEFQRLYLNERIHGLIAATPSVDDDDLGALAGMTPEETRAAIEKARADADACFQEATAAGPVKEPQSVNGSSWGGEDLAPHLDGTYRPLLPTMLQRSDGVFLLYPGRTHSFYGESESCKSWLAQYACVEAIGRGEDVVYIDFESEAAEVVGKLRMMGASAEMIRAHFHYVRPEGVPTSSEASREAWAQLLSKRWSIAVWDGVTAALSMFGAKSENNDEVTRWIKAFPERMSTMTGAAVIMIDHVTKSADGRGRFPIGAQAKVSALTGAGYLVEPKTGVAPGKEGLVEMRVGKDRPGQVRACSGERRSADRTQSAALVWMDARESGVMAVRVCRPSVDQPDADGYSRKDRELMQRVSEKLAEKGGRLTRTQLKAAVTGARNSDIVIAIDRLIVDGFVTEQQVDSRTKVLVSQEPYSAVPEVTQEGFLNG